jgi:predicted membrane-bound spermidine synthase
MKIVFTGGITGGHFFPIIAVAQKVFEITEERKLLEPKLFYFSNSPYRENLLSRTSTLVQLYLAQLVLLPSRTSH